jgi:hypothetical protein
MVTAGEPPRDVADFDRRLVLAFGPLTPAELMAELTLLETIEQAKRQNHQRVVDACSGRLAIGSAYYGVRDGRWEATR